MCDVNNNSIWVTFYPSKINNNKKIKYFFGVLCVKYYEWGIELQSSQFILSSVFDQSGGL
jgi:hypothetical protein